MTETSYRAQSGNSKCGKRISMSGESRVHWIAITVLSINLLDIAYERRNLESLQLRVHCVQSTNHRLEEELVHRGKADHLNVSDDEAGNLLPLVLDHFHLILLREEGRSTLVVSILYCLAECFFVIGSSRRLRGREIEAAGVGLEFVLQLCETPQHSHRFVH
ncbi:hypothetical protein PMAYCL1PPCAC_11904, partial [Pristionchus mayeri]